MLRNDSIFKQTKSASSFSIRSKRQSDWYEPTIWFNGCIWRKYNLISAWWNCLYSFKAEPISQKMVTSLRVWIYLIVTKHVCYLQGHVDVLLKIGLELWFIYSQKVFITQIKNRKISYYSSSYDYTIKILNLSIIELDNFHL